jgi:hypothetical protein
MVNKYCGLEATLILIDFYSLEYENNVYLTKRNR